MGRLIIDGNSVFEIDEECMKRRRPSPECDVEKYMQTEYEKPPHQKTKNNNMYNE